GEWAARARGLPDHPGGVPLRVPRPDDPKELGRHAPTLSLAHVESGAGDRQAGEKIARFMPLFMDHHDIRDATAEAVAAAHQQDLSVQAKHSCRGLTYWFDEHRGTAFCLIEAPSEAAVRAMHREAHGLIPNVIIEVRASAVAG